VIPINPNKTEYVVLETAVPFAASQPLGAEFMANGMTAPVGTRSVAPVPAKAVAVMVPAEKLPEASRATMADAVLALVAVVAELDTLLLEEIVASFVSAIAAAELMSALTMESAVIALAMVILAPPLKLVAVPVTSPEMAIVLAV
jgi:hypothetical protein